MQTSIGSKRINAGGRDGPQTGEVDGWKITRMGDVNPIDSGDGEEVQEG